MKKKKLLARVTALTLAAILMVPSSIGTTVLASPDNTEASAEAPGPDGASDKAEGTVQESASSDKSADGGQTAESQDKKSDTEQSNEQSGQSDEKKSDAKDAKEPAKTESYKVSIEDPENGLIAFPVSEEEVIKADMENPQKSLEEALKQEQKKSKKFEEGSEVQVSIAPDSGYYLVSAELLDKEGKKIQDLEVSEEGTAAFTMPESEAKITASFEAYTDEQLDQMDEEGSAAFEEELTDEEIAQIEANSGGSANEAAVCSDDSNVSAQSARIAGSKSIYLNVPGSSVRYGSYTTRYYTTNENQYAYCMNPVWKTPKAGWYTGYLIDNDVVRKAFYYAYGGPGYSSFVNSYGWIWDGSQQYEYAYTHIMLSYMYALYVLHDTGRANNAFHGVSSSVKNHIKNKATQITWMASAPAGYGCYYFDTSYINGNRRAQPMAFQVMNASTVQFWKSSSNSAFTNGNSCYSLAGAQYSIYSDAGCTNRVATLSTDGNGNTGTATLDTGTYYYKETQAPEGYELNQSVGSFYLGNCDTKVVSVSDEPVNDPSAIQITKKDKVTGDTAEGGTTMAGAQFTVSYYAGFYDQDTLPSKATRTWVVETKEKTSKNGKVYVAGLTDSYKVGGDSFYYTGTIPTIPRGTITIQETKAPEGYRNDLEMTDAQGNSSKNGVYLAQIRNEGDLTKLMGSQTFEGQDSYARSDIKLLKVNGVNDNPIANVPFKITNTRTGESHTVYTDENGIFDSSKLVNTKDTNSDQAGAGGWFGDMDLLSDDQGAFEYGDYTIEEVSSAANKGMVMYTGSFTVNGNSAAVVDLGKIVNTSIEVSTTSYGSESETNRIQFDHKAPYYDMGVYKGEYATVLCDDINVKGLTSGYIVSKLVDKETGDFVKDENGSDLQATGKLIEYNDAAAGYTATGSITMPVKDVSSMLGKDYVFFTYIYELKSDGTPNYDNLLVSHTDMNDPQETVSFQNITTELTDSSTGLHDLQTNGKTVTLKDKINLHNFPSYDEINFYYIKYEGTLMDASGNPVTDSSGNPVKSTIACHQITKDELENGTSLTYDLSADVMKKYAGQKLTSYVQVYFSYTDPSVYENYIEWAAEKDLSNEDQTVSIPAITSTYVSSDNVAYTDKGISDEVDMIGLIPGNVYTIEGKIVDKTTGKVISNTRECTYGKDEYDITKVEPSKDSNYELVKAAPYTIYHLKNAVSYEGSKAEGYYRLSDDGSKYVLCTESGQIINEEGINKNKFEQEILYPGRMFKEVRELTATTTFTAGTETANKLVNFNLDPESLAGKSYVITEDLYFSHKGSISDAEIDPAGTTVYAVLYDDGTLDFQKRKDTYASKVVTEIYRFEESDVFGSMEETPWYLNRNKVKTVSFRDKVSPQSTAYWFADFEYMTQANLDKLDTSNTTNMEGMFYYCRGLKTLDLNKLNTSNVTNMSKLFKGCLNITNLDVSNFDTSNVENMSEMFCMFIYEDDGTWSFAAVTSIKGLDKLNTSKVTNMYRMFMGCSNLSNIDVSHFDMSCVENISGMFRACYAIRALSIEKWNVSNCKDMSYVFDSCVGLATINIDNWDVSSCENMQNMFFNTPATSYNLSKWDISNVKNMRQMFMAAVNCKSITFNANAKLENIEDMTSTFENCKALTTLTLPNLENTAHLKNTCKTFYDCISLVNLDVGNLETSSISDMSYMFADCSSLTSLNVSKWDTSNVTNMRCLFYNCGNLSTLDVSKWDTGNVTDMKSLFDACRKLTSINVSNWDTSNVCNFDAMFYGCSTITSLDVSHFNTSKAIYMGGMFCECSNITSLDVSNFDTSNVTHMQAMFWACYNLTSLDVSNFDTSNVIRMQAMFQDDRSLQSLDVSNFDVSKVETMTNVFIGLNITSLDLSSWDTSNVKTMQGLFARSQKLRTIYVSELWSTKSVTDNGRYMFDNCYSLRGQSGNAYNGAISNMSTANYQSGYFTYKAAPQKTTASAASLDIPDDTIPLSSLSLTSSDTSDTEKTKETNEKQEKESVLDKVMDLLGLQSETGKAQAVAYVETPNTPALLYQHDDLNDVNETFYVPEIESTSLVNTEGEHFYAPASGTTLTDHVAMKGLKPGMTYVLTGQLMDKDTQEPAKDASGNVITATQEFTPTSSEWTADVTFSFDASNLGGKTLVAFETLTAYPKVYGTTGSMKTLSVHKDINDAAQTVTNMGIRTTAKDKVSGSKLLTVAKTSAIVDSVSYKGAVAGNKYRLQAVLMDKLTGEAAVDGDGQPITGSKDFTASATSGSVDVELTFQGTGMAGGEYVVYEQLYLVKDNGSTELWASHEDMNDKDQLVNVPGITTQLADAATNTQFVKASSSVNAVDTVYYEGLLPGQSYTLTGQLIEKATGKVFVDGNGKEMTVTKTFTPAEKSGEVDVEFSLNATNLNTSSLVAYETLSLNGKEIVSERSLDNEYQTLSFPVITSTTAVDKRNGTKVIDAQDDMTIVDTISYTGMQTGLPLTVKSTVMDKATGKAAKDSDGNDIIVESEILPDETNGSIDVEIPIKGRNLMGKTLVVYEEICYADGVVIAQHKDLNDAGQTVNVAGITTTAAIQTTAGQNDRYTNQTVRDTVKYYGLTKGTSYTLQGTLMDKATGNAYQENGKDVTASKTFKASATSGTETLDFEISSSEAKNKTLVVCESVYTEVDGKQVLVAQHSDLTDKDQTVEVPDETVGKLKVTKTIQNGNKNKAFKFTITLKGSRIKDSMMLSGVTFTNGVGTISLKHGESKLIEDIPSGTTYRVVEEQSGLYRPIMTTGDAGTIEDGKTAEAGFVNMHLKEEEPGEDEVNLTVSKKVLPEDAGAGEKFQFTAVFDHLRANWNYGLSDETEFQSDADGKATVTFTLGKGENVTFLHLPAGCTYRFTEAAGAYTSSYAVTDAAGLQKIATASGANTEEDQEISTATETADKGEKVTVTFTNEFQMSQDLTLTKKTVNADGSAYNAKEAFSFTVKFTGLPANAVISSTVGDVTADAGGNATKNVSLKNGEQVIFHELPVGSQYQITESGSEYRPSYSIDAATVVKKTDRIVKRNSSLSTQIETIDKGENDVVTFTNERIVWYALPNTGSYMLVILIGTALIMLMIASRKRKDYLSEK